MFQLAGHYLDKAEDVKKLVHLNMAATQLKTGDWNTAIYNCGQVGGAWEWHGLDWHGGMAVWAVVMAVAA